jgi:hypothetical protein
MGKNNKKQPPRTRDARNAAPGAREHEQQADVDETRNSSAQDSYDDDPQAGDVEQIDDTGNRPAAHSRLALVAIGGVLLGMLLMGGLWFVVGSGADHSTARGEPTNAEANRTPQVAGTEATASSSPDALTRCRTVELAQQAPMRAARPALDQWQVHVGAMNKLVAGTITLDQANAFWNQTRVGAARHVDAFLRAVHAYHRRGSGSCVRPEQVPDTATTLYTCAAAVAVRDDALEAAKRAARTWKRHVGQMEMLRMGHLSPARATQMWLASWRAGQRQLTTYDHTLRATRGHHC